MSAAATPPSSLAGKGPGSSRQKLWWLLVPVAGYFLLAHALPKLVPTLAVYTDYYWPRRYGLLAHDVFGLLATLLGPLQFQRWVRVAHPRVHRTLGKVYLGCVLAAALTALYLALTSGIGDLYMLGLAVAAFLWIGTGYEAWRHARARDFVLHREWMVRNYVVTFFFVLFFGLLDLTTWLGIGTFEGMATVGAWACWLVPLFVTEFLVRRGGVAV